MLDDLTDLVDEIRTNIDMLTVTGRQAQRGPQACPASAAGLGVQARPACQAQTGLQAHFAWGRQAVPGSHPRPGRQARPGSEAVPAPVTERAGLHLLCPYQVRRRPSLGRRQPLPWR